MGFHEGGGGRFAHCKSESDACLFFVCGAAVDAVVRRLMNLRWQGSASPEYVRRTTLIGPGKSLLELHATHRKTKGHLFSISPFFSKKRLVRLGLLR